MTLSQIQLEHETGTTNHHRQHTAFAKSNGEIQRIYDGLAPIYRRLNAIEEYVFGTRRLRRQLLEKASGKILDVACGTGENFVFLPKESEVTAIDLSPGMLTRAEQRARALGRHISTRVMDAAALEFPDNSFDTVVSALSTCTFSDPMAVLQEMRRVCKPDGRILLLEHGRSMVGWIGRYQDRRAHHYFQKAGCRSNQEPQENVRAAGLTILSARRSFFGIFHAMEVSPVWTQ
jgi:ubiquinone/menaquinone biosynthesis C-methylase UbiE